jgi:hypothetical protein
MTKLPLWESQCRVVVRARAANRRRDFIWEIVRPKDGTEIAVKTSVRTFETMEAAYASGAVALARFTQPSQSFGAARD